MVKRIIILRKRNIIKELENLGFNVLYAENDKIVLEPKDSNATLSARALNKILPGWEKEETLKNKIKDTEIKSMMRAARRMIHADSNSNSGNKDS